MLERVPANATRSPAAWQLPGGATRTGMVPAEQAAGLRGLLEPDIMGPPIVWLASGESAGIHDERIVATEFEQWLRAAGTAS
jgi:hypothetical protein